MKSKTYANHYLLMEPKDIKKHLELIKDKEEELLNILYKKIILKIKL